MTKIIELTQNKFTVVDDEDYLYLSKFKWCFLRMRDGSGYAARSTKSKGKNSTIYMHKIIINCPPGMEADHIDRDKLNNVRCNLRLATQSQNAINSLRKNSTGYRGVFRSHGKFKASIQCNNKTFYSGKFDDAKSAAKAYNEMAEKHHREFAILNDV